MASDVKTSKNIIVLIASHLGSQKRHSTLLSALLSININTYHPSSIYISYSTSKNVIANTKLWEAICHPIPLVLYPKKSKHTQFQHYESLAKELNPDTFCLFLDDDDQMHYKKIEMITKHMNEDTQICHHIALEWCAQDDTFMGTIESEYHCFGCRAKYLQQFVKEHDVSDDFADIKFLRLLMENGGIYIPRVLSYIRIDRNLSRDYQGLSEFDGFVVYDKCLSELLTRVDNN